MREIKFRAWDKCFEEMVEVVSIDWGNEDVVVLDKDLRIPDTKDFSEVVLVQYTGLKDKKGVEIYEGDILVFDRFLEKYQGIVVWVDRSLSFCIQTKEERFFLADRDNNALVVIGNIHDNPELLEAENNK